MTTRKKNSAVLSALLVSSLLLSLTTLPASAASNSHKTKIAKAMKVRDTKLASLKADVAKKRKAALDKAKLDLEASRALSDETTRSATRKSAYSQLKDTNEQIRAYYQKQLKAIYAQYRKSVA